MEILIGTALLDSKLLTTLARNAIDGDALVSTLVARGIDIDHETHMAIIKWYWRITSQFAKSSHR